MGSRNDALAGLREYLSDLLGIKLAPRAGDLGNSNGLAGLATVAPLHQETTISVRSGGLLSSTQAEPASKSNVLVGSIEMQRVVSTAPRHRVRVFVDIRHGQDEVKHFDDLEQLLAKHPINQVRRLAASTLDWMTGAESSIAQGQVYTTTYTGWLEFDFIEGITVRDERLLKTVIVSSSDSPYFVDPNSQLPVLETELIEEE